MAFGGWVGLSGCALRVGVSLWLALLTAVTVGPRPAAAEEPRAALATPDFFGVVGRDPWYEFDAVTGQPKRAFQEAMARNIAAAGLEVTVWNRTREKADELAGDRISVGDTPAEAARNRAATRTVSRRSSRSTTSGSSVSRPKVSSDPMLFSAPSAA